MVDVVFFVVLYPAQHSSSCNCSMAHTLNNVSYRRIILGWNECGRESCVSGEGSMAGMWGSVVWTASLLHAKNDNNPASHHLLT